jgi:hypothetical protein
VAFGAADVEAAELEDLLPLGGAVLPAPLERLLERLADTPTPAGRTPREIEQAPAFIPLTSLTLSHTAKE